MLKKLSFFTGAIVTLALPALPIQAADAWSAQTSVGGTYNAYGMLHSEPPPIHYPPYIRTPPLHYGPQGVYQAPLAPVQVTPPSVVYPYPAPEYRSQKHGPHWDRRDYRYVPRSDWHRAPAPEQARLR